MPAKQKPKSYYEILGVPKSASEDEIKKAYFKLSRETHPDHHPGDKVAYEKFLDVTRAYEVLSNAQKRKEYDSLGG